MQSIRIKEEVNSDDDEDNKESQATFINNFEFKNEGDDSKNVNVVKKEEIVFGGSPKKLQIRPLTASLKEEVADDGSLADNETLKEPPPKIHTAAIDLNAFELKSDGDDSKDVKKELIVFAGLPQTLQIRPLPYEMMIEGVTEEEPLTSTINFPPNLNRERNFTCALCAKRIGTRGGLLYHVKTHFKGRPYKCDVCNRSYATKNDFETHFKRHAGDNFTCDFCSKNFQVKDYLLVHLRAIHFPRVFPCTDCKKVKYFSSKQDLIRHYGSKRNKLMAKINAEFQCKLCKAKFSKLKDYAKHCTEREFLKFKCATCSKKFPCYKLLQKHVIEERKAGFCDICKTTVKSLKMHMDRRHRKYTCDMCKIFESMNYSELCKHVRFCAKYVDVQALGHFCSICDEHFHNIAALHKHLNTKHPHLWCAKCSKSYHSEFLLQRHIKDSHKRNKYGKMQMQHFKCILCDPPKNFYVKGCFNNHFQSAHGAGGRASNRKFNCARCKRPHSSKAKLVKHIAQICYSPKIDLIPQRSTRSSNKTL